MGAIWRAVRSGQVRSGNFPLCAVAIDAKTVVSGSTFRTRPLSGSALPGLARMPITRHANGLFGKGQAGAICRSDP